MKSEELTHLILQEIDRLLKSGVLPVSVDHLKHLDDQGDILHYLIIIKNEGLISGDLVTIGTGGTPHRMTNIRLTYLGIKALSQPAGRKSPDNKEMSQKSNARKDT